MPGSPLMEPTAEPVPLDDAALNDLAQAQGIDPLIVGLLHLLWLAPDAAWVSLPRLVKHLRSSGSEVLRTLTPLNQAEVNNPQGMGWTEVRHEGWRWQARLTAEGRLQCSGLFNTAAQD